MRKDKIKFIKKATLFVASFGIILALSNHFYLNFISSNKIHEQLEDRYEEFISKNSPSHIQYAFFGDSHVMININHDLIPGSFNFGISEETYVETYYKLKKLLDDGVEIDKIILQVDPHTFTDHRRPFKEAWYYAKSVPLTEISRITEKPIIGLWSQYLFPFIGYGERDLHSLLKAPDLFFKVFGIKEDNEMNSKTSGFDLLDKGVAEAKKSYQIHFGEYELFDPQFTEYFFEVISLATSNDIDIVFIQYPLSSYYEDELLRNRFDRDSFYNFIYSEANTVVPNPYRVLNYYNLYFDKPSYFQDTHHLNHIGEADFTLRVKEDLSD